MAFSPAHQKSVDELIKSIEAQEHPLPSADDLAAALGFLKSRRRPKFRNEATRYEKIMQLVSGLSAPSVDREQEAVVMSRFCAVYLPQLVNSFLDFRTPKSDLNQHFPLFSPYFQILAMVKNNPYFAKFMLADTAAAKRGTQLAKRVAELLAGFGEDSEMDRSCGSPEEHIVGPGSHLLSNILVLRPETDGPDAIPMTLKQRLLPVLDKWVIRYEGTHTGTTLRLAAGLVRRENIIKGGNESAKDYLEGLQKCAWKGCEARRNLYQCARCKTVLYCSRKHQQEHWAAQKAPHKSLCHKTTF